MVSAQPRVKLQQQQAAVVGQRGFEFVTTLQPVLPPYAQRAQPGSRRISQQQVETASENGARKGNVGEKEAVLVSGQPGTPKKQAEAQARVQGVAEESGKPK